MIKIACIQTITILYKYFYICKLDLRYYKFKTLELVKKVNLVLGLTQENSIENSIQNHLPYISRTHSPC